MISKVSLCLVACLSLTAPALMPAAAQIITLTPKAIAFGPQAVGTTSAVQTVTVKNTSTSKALAITSISVSGDFPNSTSCGSSLAAGATCTINVSFSPGAVGSIAGAITILDDASPNPQVVNLTGKAVTPVTLSRATL